MKDQIICTADNEEPNCMNCDMCYICDGSNCGPEYGWWKYTNTVYSEED